MTRLKTLILMSIAAATACGPAGKDAANVQPTKIGDAIRQAQQNTKGGRPAQTGQVVVLELEVSSAASAPGAAPGAPAAQAAPRQVTARVTKVQMVVTAAPKVFARSAGEWEVRLIGRTPLSYRIPNPLTDIEVENPPGSKSPFSQVEPSGPVPVQIVVPLTRDGRTLGVQTIEIVDTATGQRIVSVPLTPAAVQPSR